MVCPYEDYKDCFEVEYEMYCGEGGRFTLGELLSYELTEYECDEYTETDTCCILIGLARIAMEQKEDILCLREGLEAVLQEEVIKGCKEELGEEFPVFLKDCEKVKKVLMEEKER